VSGSGAEYEVCQRAAGNDTDEFVVPLGPVDLVVFSAHRVRRVELPRLVIEPHAPGSVAVRFPIAETVQLDLADDVAALRGQKHMLLLVDADEAVPTEPHAARDLGSGDDRLREHLRRQRSVSMLRRRIDRSARILELEFTDHAATLSGALPGRYRLVAVPDDVDLDPHWIAIPDSGGVRVAVRVSPRH
jgi:hypothetical protein